MGGAGQRYTDSVQDCCNFETLRRTGISVVSACDLSGKATISKSETNQWQENRGISRPSRGERSTLKHVVQRANAQFWRVGRVFPCPCLLYTSDAADER